MVLSIVTSLFVVLGGWFAISFLVMSANRCRYLDDDDYIYMSAAYKACTTVSPNVLMAANI